MAENESGIRIPLAGLIASLITSFSLGGSATGAWLSIQNGERAINVAVQHGGEIAELNRRLAELETDLIRRTAERWTRSDHLRFETQSARQQAATDRRISALERIVDKHIDSEK